MEDYIKRLISEKKELFEKTDKLSKFLDTDIDKETQNPDGCKYCKHGVALIDNSNSTVYLVDESIVMVSEFECFNCERTEKESGSVEVNYCPMCGNKLTK